MSAPVKASTVLMTQVLLSGGAANDSIERRGDSASNAGADSKNCFLILKIYQRDIALPAGQSEVLKL